MYYVYFTEHAPEELTLKHRYAAVYGPITLFVTGAADPVGVVNLAEKGFNYPYNQEGTGLTVDEFDDLVDTLIDPNSKETDHEIWISKPQADYIKATRFPTSSEIT
jgi:hypothetical protein